MKNIKLSNRTKGVLFIIMSAFGFAMMSAFVKLSLITKDSVESWKIRKF